jgi:3-keto-disaccharide hydrolase
MKQLIRLTPLAIAPLVLAVFVQAQTPEPGFTSLFNGKDFTDWKVGGPAETFTVQDGAIVARGTPSMIYYDGPFRSHAFRNFQLKVDVMTRPGSNGGIWIMTDYQDRVWPAKGFEIQVNNSHTDPIRTGSLYHVQDVINDSPAKDDVWCTIDILAQGDTIAIRVDDNEVVRWTQPPDWNGSRDFRLRRVGPGTIGFQGHDPNSVVYYKNIRIKPLD